MKIAFAGKGGVGKTSLATWTADWLARNGHNVWLIDADTALSLGQASGIAQQDLPEPLICRSDLIRNRIHEGTFLNLNPEVSDLPETLAIDLPLGGGLIKGIEPGRKRLVVMGAVTNAGGGCACDANALLKAVLAHIVIQSNDWVIVDLEAGVEHLGRGTVAYVDGLIVVSEPSLRSLQTGAEVGRMATDLGLHNQVLVLNRHTQKEHPTLPGLPKRVLSLPPLAGLIAQQMTTSSVLGLPEQNEIDSLIKELLSQLEDI